jgi:nucleotide-binding universal stress UspA family protein
MFADILLVPDSQQLAVSYGLSFAQAFDADVTAVWPSAAPAFRDLVGAELRYDLLVGRENGAQEKRIANQRDFVSSASALGVRSQVVADAELHERYGGNISHLARAYDLVIVEQSPATQYARSGGLIGSLISGCGRPVLAIPFIQKAPPSFANILVAWDASASAARALGDALPLLKRANFIEIVTIANAGRERVSPDCDDVVRHLSRHGIPAAPGRIPGGDTTADTLLSYVADRGVTLMITGSYGHTRLAEGLVGGVTRTLLESMTVPLFMSH